MAEALMLPSMFLAGVYQGIKNEQNYNSTCKQVDEAEEKLAQTLDTWQQMCANEDKLNSELTTNQENMRLTIAALKKATENVDKQYRQEIRTTEITLSIMIFIIIVLLTVKRFRIVEKITQIFI